MGLYSVILCLTIGLVAISKCENGYNAVFDEVLQYFNDKMKSENNCSKGLPYVSFSVEKEVLNIPLTALVSSTEGKLKDICTFRRSGDVVLTQTDQSSITLALGIDMDDLEVESDVKITILFYENNNTLKAIIAQPSLQGQVTVSLPSTGVCSINVDYVQVKSLGDMHIYLNDKELLFIDFFANATANVLKQNVTSIIENKIQTILRSEEVCDKIKQHGISLQ